jgi:dihydrofolate synthase/folylpolyglutamate synthase
LAATWLPGRLWHVEDGMYADIAHNAEKMHALVGAMQARFADLGKLVVVGMSGHRVPERVFVELARIAKTIIVTSASYKGQDPGKVRGAMEALVGDIPLMVVGDPVQALNVAKALRGPHDMLLLTGSTYMIEQMLNPDPQLRHLSATFGWRMQTDTEATGTVQLSLPKPPSPLR